jgi:hypothetical protein
MPELLDWQLIDRYLAGEASPAEVADLHARARTNPDWANALDLLRYDFEQLRARPGHRPGLVTPPMAATSTSTAKRTSP